MNVIYGSPIGILRALRDVITTYLPLTRNPIFKRGAAASPSLIFPSLHFPVQNSFENCIGLTAETELRLTFSHQKT